jgi:hypothetical protein
MRVNTKQIVNMLRKGISFGRYEPNYPVAFITIIAMRGDDTSYNVATITREHLETMSYRQFKKQVEFTRWRMRHMLKRVPSTEFIVEATMTGDGRHGEVVWVGGANLGEQA